MLAAILIPVDWESPRRLLMAALTLKKSRTKRTNIGKKLASGPGAAPGPAVPHDIMVIRTRSVPIRP